MIVSQSGAPADPEALDWVIRMGEPDADWDAFTTWLEADGGNAARYDRASSAMAEVDAAVAAVPLRQSSETVHVEANDRETGLHGYLRKFAPWVGVAAAAAVVGVVSIKPVDGGPQSYLVATSSGQQRTVALADGSSVELAGGSAVRLDRNNLREAIVERGQMTFHVVHNEKRPFAVRVGDLRVVDLGTVFDVKAKRLGAEVAVAEGAVMVDPAGAALHLGAGQMVMANGTTLQRRQILPANVGSWRQGRLVFEQATFADVADDLSRQLGRPVRVTPPLARQSFSGTLDVRTFQGRPQVLGRLLGVTVKQDGQRWILSSHE